MQRMLCSVLSLVMIMSSLGGCAAAPVRPEVAGPEVYGYTLYQTMSGKQFQPLTGTGKGFAGDLELYLQAAPDGGVFGLYVGRDSWLDTVSKTSKLYVTEPECEAARQVEEGQLKAIVEGFNARQVMPRRVGDLYAVEAVDACKAANGQAYRYTIWTTLQAFSAGPGQPYPYKVEPQRSLAMEIAFVAVAIPVVVAAVILTGGQVLSDCTYVGTLEEGKKECDRKREEKQAREHEQNADKERLESGYQ
jgi:hypothetical protein